MKEKLQSTEDGLMKSIDSPSYNLKAQIEKWGVEINPRLIVSDENGNVAVDSKSFHTTMHNFRTFVKKQPLSTPAVLLQWCAYIYEVAIQKYEGQNVSISDVDYVYSSNCAQYIKGFGANWSNVDEEIKDKIKSIAEKLTVNQGRNTIIEAITNNKVKAKNLDYLSIESLRNSNQLSLEFKDIQESLKGFKEAFKGTSNVNERAEILLQWSSYLVEVVRYNPLQDFNVTRNKDDWEKTYGQYIQKFDWSEASASQIDIIKKISEHLPKYLQPILDNVRPIQIIKSLSIEYFKEKWDIKNNPELIVLDGYGNVLSDVNGFKAIMNKFKAFLDNQTDKDTHYAEVLLQWGAYLVEVAIINPTTTLEISGNKAAWITTYGRYIKKFDWSKAPTKTDTVHKITNYLLEGLNAIIRNAESPKCLTIEYFKEKWGVEINREYVKTLKEAQVSEIYGRCMQKSLQPTLDHVAPFQIKGIEDRLKGFEESFKSTSDAKERVEILLQWGVYLVEMEHNTPNLNVIEQISYKISYRDAIKDWKADWQQLDQVTKNKINAIPDRLSLDINITQSKTTAVVNESIAVEDQMITQSFDLFPIQITPDADDQYDEIINFVTGLEGLSINSPLRRHREGVEELSISSPPKRHKVIDQIEDSPNSETNDNPDLHFSSWQPESNMLVQGGEFFDID